MRLVKILGKGNKERIVYYKACDNNLFNNYLKDLENNNEESIIYQSYLNSMNEEYKNNNTFDTYTISYGYGVECLGRTKLHLF